MLWMILRIRKAKLLHYVPFCYIRQKGAWWREMENFVEKKGDLFCKTASWQYLVCLLYTKGSQIVMGEVTWHMIKNFRVECKGKYQHCWFNIRFFPHLCVYRWLIGYNFLYLFVEHILLLVISCIDWNFLHNKPCSQAIFFVEFLWSMMEQMTIA